MHLDELCAGVNWADYPCEMLTEMANSLGASEYCIAHAICRAYLSMTGSNSQCLVSYSEAKIIIICLS